MRNGTGGARPQPVAVLFERMKRDGAEAIVAQPILTGYRDRIVVLATAARLPVISDVLDVCIVALHLVKRHHQILRCSPSK